MVGRNSSPVSMRLAVVVLVELRLEPVPQHRRGERPQPAEVRETRLADDAARSTRCRPAGPTQAASACAASRCATSSTTATETDAGSALRRVAHRSRLANSDDAAEQQQRHPGDERQQPSRAAYASP